MVTQNGPGLDPPPRIAEVTGGAGGVEASYDDMLRLAGLFDGAGDDLRQDAWDDKAIAVNGDLLESAILSPVSFADAEEAIVAATLGPDGLAFRAVGLEADALSMQVTVTLYRTADDLVRASMEAIDYTAGFVLGASAPLLVVAAAGGGAVLLSNPILLTLLAAHGEDLTDLSVQEVQQLLEDNPGLVQHLINGGGGLLDGFNSTLPPGAREALLSALGIDPFHGTTNDAAGDLADLFTDSEVSVTPSAADRSLTEPTSIEDLINNLGQTNDGADGDIDIQQIGTGQDARYIVNLPGTDSFGTDPGDVRDLQANLQLIGGEETAYARGIREAMERAGIPPGAPIMLVGHSQGGMTAAQMAADPDFSSQYDVRHVVTAGAPTAQVPHIPDHTQVLSLENTGDVVPLTDGEDNPDQPNRTTVRFDDRQGSVGANHSLETYAQGGRAVDGSTHPSLAETLDQLRSDGFLGSGEPTSTSGYTIVRDRG